LSSKGDIFALGLEQECPWVFHCSLEQQRDLETLFPDWGKVFLDTVDGNVYIYCDAVGAEHFPRSEISDLPWKSEISDLGLDWLRPRSGPGFRGQSGAPDQDPGNLVKLGQIGQFLVKFRSQDSWV